MHIPVCVDNMHDGSDLFFPSPVPHISDTHMSGWRGGCLGGGGGVTAAAIVVLADRLPVPGSRDAQRRDPGTQKKLLRPAQIHTYGAR